MVTRQELLEKLQVAAELELATIPPYLTALYSLKQEANRAAAETIRSVVVEEMLHLTVVGNVMSSIGGGVSLGQNAVPVYPVTLNFNGVPFEDRRFAVDLAAFSPASLETFLSIEEPSTLRLIPFRTELDIPEPTVGDFYMSIIADLESLNAIDPAALFIGDPTRQIGPDYYWSSGGELLPVHDLESAKAALLQVIGQGEGAWVPGDGGEAGFGEPFEVGHYYRFKELSHGRRYLPSDDPAGLPTGDLIGVDFTQVWPIMTNGRQADYIVGSAAAQLNAAFNESYTRLLIQVEEALTGTPKSLYPAILEGMHNLSITAAELVSTPVEGDKAGRTACPSFEWRQ
ncbi:ferritin-like protein [Mesorhizobium sp.]|uniref:ferritin-like domain-containing protein n=1 Tax=Mesorhizobium sp. TaxID=1871066 RepID=UPI0011FB1C2E|nr:ferritin-like protein [Mesorhizobium sp.]TIP18434.1 MAG: hypothetical protein E5X66_15750 [Mesorhizobium sp.]